MYPSSPNDTTSRNIIFRKEPWGDFQYLKDKENEKQKKEQKKEIRKKLKERREVIKL